MTLRSRFLSLTTSRVRGACLAFTLAWSSTCALAASDGIQFDCGPAHRAVAQVGMGRYLAELGIAPALYRVEVNEASGAVTWTLNTAPDDHNTLDLHQRPGFDVGDEIVALPRQGHAPERVRTVSKKEIVLALMQHGRLTRFSGQACDIQALKDLVGVRQNIVAWSEHLHWVWPDGGPARWNTRYWRKGTPLKTHPLHAALLDTFTHQDRYAIGCYTATKIVVLQGILDYHRRIKADTLTSQLILARVWADGDPLVDIEPGNMWFFEEDFDPREQDRPGKVVKMKYGVAPRNFVPGDWAYFVNTDPATHHKTGYEGSNALYMGRNRFDDYYNDHQHAYSYDEKLGEVFQWRNGVFSRTRDAAKIQPLTPADMDRLSQRPVHGGLVKGYRVVPYLFGYEPLPAMPRP